MTSPITSTPLKYKGYRVFHDLPASENGKPFNIDHIVVGPSGVFAVETKTRRKGRARPGREDHKVRYDGNLISWPWGEDDWGLQQAHRQSKWLENRIEELTTERVAVQPLLALPGWYVTETKKSRIRVLNSKNIPSAIVGRPSLQPALDAKQIERISCALADACKIGLNEPGAN